MRAYFAAARDAGRAVLIAHAVKTLFALLVLGDFWLGLIGFANSGDPIDVVRHFLQQGLRQLEAASWAVFAYLVAGPALTQYVLAALARREQPAAAALQRYGRALALSALRLGAFGVTATFTFAFAHQLPMHVPSQLETPARLIPAALGGASLLWLATAHDAAAAWLAADEAPSAWRALVRGVQTSGPALVAFHVSFMIGAILAYVIGEVAGRMLMPALSTMLSQALALGAALMNAAWLAAVMTRTRQPIRASQ